VNVFACTASIEHAVLLVLALSVTACSSCIYHKQRIVASVVASTTVNATLYAAYFCFVLCLCEQEINAAAEVIYENVDPAANIIFGALVDERMQGEMSITVLATGFQTEEEVMYLLNYLNLSTSVNGTYQSCNKFKHRLLTSETWLQLRCAATAVQLQSVCAQYARVACN
jgi:FtsZ family, C-terminal domain